MAEVQHRMEQEDEEQAGEEQQAQWREVVEDIWTQHLPHFRGDVYMGEGDFVYDAATGHYGFQYESGSEADDLMEGGGESGEEEEEGKEDDEFVEVSEEEEQSQPPESVQTEDECK